jgi:hypothetical protein
MDATHCGLQPHSEPLVVAGADGPEFSLYKNVIFDALPMVGGPAAQIKLTK